MPDSHYVLCVTLNPCLDKTLTVPDWRPGDNVRGTAVREVVGGKGNNVARALNRLGRSARPATFLGGDTGRRCEALLRSDDGFSPLIVSSQAQTRTILTVRTSDGAEQTAFFDPDPLITASEAERFLIAFEEALASGSVAAVTLSGSSPADATHGLYREFVLRSKSAGVPVLVDTYGPASKRLGEVVPDIVQLNRKELAGILGKPLQTLEEKESFDWLTSRVRLGAKLAVMTQGPDDILAASADGFLWRASPPPIEPVNPIGSGDSFLAGLCQAWLEKRSPADSLRFAVACATANALEWDAGAVDEESVRKLVPEVRVTRSDRTS